MKIWLGILLFAIGAWMIVEQPNIYVLGLGVLFCIIGAVLVFKE